MTLEQQARATGLQMERLLQSAQATHTTLAQVQRDVAERAEQLGEGRVRAVQAFDATAEACTSASSSLAERAESLRERLVALRTHLQERRTEGAREVDALLERAGAFDDAVAQLRGQLDERLDATEAAQSALSASAEDAASAVHDVVAAEEARVRTDVVSALQSVQAAAEQRSERLAVVIAEAAIPAIEERSRAFAERLTVTAARIAERLAAAGNATRDGGQQLVEQAREQTESEAQGLRVTVEGGAEGLVQLGVHAADTATSLIHTGEAVSAGGKATNVGINAAIGILREVSELFQRILT